MTTGNTARKQPGPLSIAVLVKRYTTSGGAERYAVEITRRLAGMGHHVQVFTRESDEPDRQRVLIRRVKKRYTFSGAASLYGFARDTAEMVLRHGPFDVVHSHDRTIAQDIATLHTFTHLSGMAGGGLLKRYGNLLSPRNRLHLWLEKRQMATPVLAAVSPLVAENAAACYPGRTDIHVLPPGVDCKMFHPDQLGPLRDAARKKWRIARDAFVILFVGTEFRRKGLDILIAALPAGVHLVVAGKGDGKKETQLALNAKAPAIKTTFAGLARDIRPFYAMSDLLVLPSRREAFGMVVLEAMASGLPVVCSSATGAASLVTHGKNGFVCATPAELRQLLQKCREQGVPPELAAAGRKTAMDHSWENTAAGYETLYHEIRNGKKS